MVTDETDKEGFSERLNAVLDAAGIPKIGDGRQGVLAEMFGVSDKGARKWIQAESIPRHGIIKKIVEKFRETGVTYEWLMSGDPKLSPFKKSLTPENNYAFPKEKQLSEQVNYPDPGFKPVRFGSFRLQAGIVGFSIEYLNESQTPLYFHVDWLHKKGLKAENLTACTITGDSMETGLYDGDTVVIDTSKTVPQDGDVFAINYEGELLIKRLYRDAGHWYLQSDNPDKTRHPNKLCAGDICLIIGKIVHKQSNKI
ncbi:helix-turn-helix transcriptional regulator [Methylomonas sp. HYX-M1]|uniref:S24 family peptidase n=1 Tax=Methylomonas sp. HYX-M1 TaxID=3139307 RepID=UPI00345B6084